VDAIRESRSALRSSGAPRWEGLEPLRPSMERYLSRRCRDRSELDDVVQETFLRAARYRKRDMSAGRLRSWLLCIAANVLRDHARRGLRGPSTGVDEELFERVESRELAAPDDDEQIVDLGDQLLDRESALAHLARGMVRLSARDREVLGLYYREGESTAWVAERCGISPQLVKVRLFRARRRLERALRLEEGLARTRRLALG
jgi:RNA polymerase sigma-70 factor (ECF subfamily)